MRIAMQRAHEASTGGESGGKALAEERKRLGLSQGQLARFAGLSLRQVREAERRPAVTQREVAEALRRAVDALQKRIRRARSWLVRHGAQIFEPDSGPPLPPASGWRPSSRVYCGALLLLRKYDIGEAAALMLLRERNAAAATPVPDKWLVEAAEDAAHAAQCLREWDKHDRAAEERRCAR
ncbi:MAG: hypothetical protein U1A78_41695 [Polyangia bacterium]